MLTFRCLRVSNDQLWTLGITGFSAVFGVICVILGLLWRAGNRWGELTTEVKHLAQSVGQIAIDTNERLQWLERKGGRDRSR
jgi:hypothetical protein